MSGAIDLGALSEALNNKADLDMYNVNSIGKTNIIDYADNECVRLDLVNSNSIFRGGGCD